MVIWIIVAIALFVGFVALTGAPYVPSKPTDIRRAFTELYPLGATDVIVDIGSGDGIVLRQASKCGAKAIGYEIHPVLVVISRILSRHDSNVRVHMANFWAAAFPADTTVVYTFGDSRDIKRMYAKVQSESTRLGRPLVFISYGFDIPGVNPYKSAGAHHLYKLTPLQSGEGSI